MFDQFSTSNRTDLTPPTVRLPPIRSLRTTALSELSSCVDYLRFLYTPEVRGSRRRKTSARKDYEQEMEDRVETIRADAFERSHAIRWLTSLISHGDESRVDSNNGNDERIGYESLIENAAALLATCAGTAASGRVSRTYSFGPTPRGEEASLMLMDAPLENGDYASVGAQTWGGACVMADVVFESPEQFDLPVGGTNDEKPFRVLELGAGTGLVGLSIAKLLDLRRIRADVVLTDVHPSVLVNLRSNTLGNFPVETKRYVDVSVTVLDWSSYASTSTPGKDALGMFDLIVGADIIYEPEHAVWIRSCLKEHLRINAFFHLVIPLRSTHTAESSTVEQVFGDESSLNNFTVVHQEHFSCDAHNDTDARLFSGTDEVEYAYYKIGWKETQIRWC